MIKLEGAYEIIGSGTFILLNVAIERKGQRLWKWLMVATDWETILTVAMICGNRARKIEGLNCAQTIMSTQLRQMARGILWWVRKLYHGINRILHDLSFWMDIFLSRKRVLLIKHFDFGKARWGSNQSKIKYVTNSFYGKMQMYCRVSTQSFTQRNN